jgi:drug/metabolite transporter (DMT)-like permease
MSAVTYALLALISFTVSNVFYRLVAKNEEDTSTLGMLYTTIAGLFALPLVFIIKTPLFDYHPDSYLIIISIIAWSAFSYLLAWANQKFEASTNSILNQLTSVFSVLISVLLLGEVIITKNFIGIALIIAGNILLSLKDSNISFDKSLLTRASLSLIQAIALLSDKLASQHINNGVYIFIVYFVPGLILWLILPGVTLTSMLRVVKKHHYRLCIASLGSLLGFFFLIESYKVGELGIIIPILNSSVITITLASALFLKERKDLGFKLLMGLIVSLGVIIISWRG